MIRKRGKRWCVLSEHNPDWSGGCYRTKKEAEARLRQVERAKHARRGRRGVRGYGGPVKDYLRAVREMRRLDQQADDALYSGDDVMADSLRRSSWEASQRAAAIRRAMTYEEKDRARQRLERGPEGQLYPYGRIRRRRRRGR